MTATAGQGAGQGLVRVRPAGPSVMLGTVPKEKEKRTWVSLMRR